VTTCWHLRPRSPQRSKWQSAISIIALLPNIYKDNRAYKNVVVLKALKISLETKLNFESPEDRKTLIDAMHKYSALVRYGIKTLKPQLEQKKETYQILTEKFPDLPARTISLVIKEDISATINSFAGLEAKNFPISMRFDKDNSEFFVDDDRVKLRFAVERPQKGVLKWITADLMSKRNLAYKYYKYLFSTKKGYKLPFRLMMRNGQIYAKITIDRHQLIADSTKPTVYVGIDVRAHWIGQNRGNPLAVAFLNEDGTFARQPILMHEWAEIPLLIRRHQRDKRKFKKIITNQIGIIVKQLIEYTKDYNPVFKLEDLTNLNKLRGPYSKIFYRKFKQTLQAKSLNIIMVNPAYTTQKCSRCGEKGKTEKRTFFCKKCYPRGFNKFINAAINIAKGDVK